MSYLALTITLRGVRPLGAHRADQGDISPFCVPYISTTLDTIKRQPASTHRENQSFTSLHSASVPSRNSANGTRSVPETSAYDKEAHLQALLDNDSSRIPSAPRWSSAVRDFSSALMSQSTFQQVGHTLTTSRYRHSPGGPPTTPRTKTRSHDVRQGFCTTTVVLGR